MTGPSTAMLERVPVIAESLMSVAVKDGEPPTEKMTGASAAR